MVLASVQVVSITLRTNSISTFNVATTRPQDDMTRRQGLGPDATHSGIIRQRQLRDSPGDDWVWNSMPIHWRPCPQRRAFCLPTISALRPRDQKSRVLPNRPHYITRLPSLHNSVLLLFCCKMKYSLAVLAVTAIVSVLGDSPKEGEVCRINL